MANIVQMGIEAVVKGLENYLHSVGKMDQANKNFGKGADATSKEMENVGTSSDMLTKALGVLTISGFVYAGERALKAALDLAVFGAEALRVENAFMRVSQGVGESGDAILEAMDSATGRVISDEALMQTATKGMIMGLRMGTEEWAALARGAQYHARLIGTSAQEVFSTMVDAITRGQPRMLAALSFPGAKDAINQLADSLDSSATSMTEAERQAALLALTMKVLNDEQAKFGAASSDMISQTARWAENYDRLRESIGGGLAQLFTPQLEKVNRQFEETANGMALLKAAMSGQITIGQFWDAIWGRVGGKIRSLAVLFPQAAEEGNRFKGTLTNLSTANRKFVDSLPKLKDLEGWKEYIRLATELPNITLNLNETAKSMDKFRDKLYGGEGLLANAEAVVQSAKIDEEIRKDNEQLAKDMAKAQEDAAKEAQRAWESAWDELRSSVEAALQPTEVTLADMAATAAGIYVDKWDEASRRLRAISERGFAELIAHPDWETALKIPESVMAGTEQQLREWATQRMKAPEDLFDVNAAVAVVEQYMAQQAAHKAFIDEVTAAYAAKHGLGITAGQQAVAGALGEPDQAARAAIEGLPKQMTAWVKDTAPAIALATEPLGAAVLDGILAGIDKGWPAFVQHLLDKFAGIVTALTGPGATGQTITGGGVATVNAPPLLAPAHYKARGVTHIVGGDTIIQNISDPQAMYLALALAQDRKRTRWNTGMGVA